MKPRLAQTETDSDNPGNKLDATVKKEIQNGADKVQKTESSDESTNSFNKVETKSENGVFILPDVDIP